MKSIINSGILSEISIICFHLAPACSMPTGAAAPYVQDGKAGWHSSTGTRSSGGTCDVNKGFKNNNGAAKIEFIKGGRGFALNGNKFHAINLIVIGEINVQPSKVRDFLRSDDTRTKTPREIKKEIRAMAGAPTYNGNLSFGERNYTLTNIKMTLSRNRSTVCADLALQAKGATNATNDSIVGHVKLVTTTNEGPRVSDGDLTLDGADYRVLIDMKSLKRERTDGKFGAAEVLS